MPATPSNTKWLPSIDGIRGLAVAAVVIHHTNGATLRDWALGNIGVAVFFSVSGFLAYYVLWHDEIRFGKIRYNYFLARRIVRIWPAYVAIILLVSFLTWLRGAPVTGLIHFATFSLNFEMSSWRSWPMPELAPLWSIAVEEQFYILAPLMYRAIRSRNGVAFCVIVVFCSNLARAFFIAQCDNCSGNGGLYYTSFAYADTFLGGAIVAHFHLRGWSPRHETFIAVAAVLLLVIVARVWAPFPPYTVFSAVPYVVLPAAGALVIISALGHSTVIRILSFPALRALGAISYSVYLVHVVAITAAARLVGTQQLLYNVITIMLTVAFALIIYFSVERPLRRLKSSISPNAFAPLPATISIVAVSAGLILYIGFQQ